MQGETTGAMQDEATGAMQHGQSLEPSPPSVFDDIPPEVAGLIYQLLRPKDIKSARLVSRCVSWSWLCQYITKAISSLCTSIGEDAAVKIELLHSTTSPSIHVRRRWCSFWVAKRLTSESKERLHRHHEFPSYRTALLRYNTVLPATQSVTGSACAPDAGLG